MRSPIIRIRIRLPHTLENGFQRKNPDYTKPDLEQQLKHKGRSREQRGQPERGKDVRRQRQQKNNKGPALSGFVAQCHFMHSLGLWYLSKVVRIRAASSTQSAKGSVTKIVSSRSGEVERSATGHWINSSTRRTYLIASAGSSAQLRAPSVDCDHPGISS